tara:strand:+ start:142 stop:969 length:828 start_codon:yes stop_codon:yes gene_type:complete
MRKNNKNYTDIYSYFVLKKNINEKMMKKIFSLLRVDSTFMTTSYNRMFDVNLILKKYINKYFSKKPVICDFAVSSGQSTLELLADLNKQKIQNIYGFDKKIHITIYKLGKLIFLYSAKNELLMVEYDKQCLRYRYYFFFKKIEKFLPNLFNKLYLFDLINIEYKKSKLLIPSLDKVNQLKFYEQDIFNIDKKYFNFFDVVRVSNLLNYSYFSKTQLKKAISNIKKISKDNSIIIVNRTPNKKKKNTASFFRKKRGKFQLMEDINGGSEIKKLMLL